jgi:hypothetical protein
MCCAVYKIEKLCVTRPPIYRRMNMNETVIGQDMIYECPHIRWVGVLSSKIKTLLGTLTTST